IRDLNKDYNHDLKGLFKGAATRASVKPGPLQEFYQRSLAKGIKPTMVRLTLARKIAAITLTLWKKGARPTRWGGCITQKLGEHKRGKCQAAWCQLKSAPQQSSAAKAAYRLWRVSARQGSMALVLAIV